MSPYGVYPYRESAENCKYLMSLMISLCNCGSGQRIFHVLLPPRLPNLNLHNKIQIQQVQQDQKVAKNSGRDAGSAAGLVALVSYPLADPLATGFSKSLGGA